MVSKHLSVQFHGRLYRGAAVGWLIYLFYWHRMPPHSLSASRADLLNSAGWIGFAYGCQHGRAIACLDARSRSKTLAQASNGGILNKKNERAEDDVRRLYAGLLAIGGSQYIFSNPWTILSNCTSTTIDFVGGIPLGYSRSFICCHSLGWA